MARLAASPAICSFSSTDLSAAFDDRSAAAALTCDASADVSDAFDTLSAALADRSACLVVSRPVRRWMTVEMITPTIATKAARAVALGCNQSLVSSATVSESRSTERDPTDAALRPVGFQRFGPLLVRHEVLDVSAQLPKPPGDLLAGNLVLCNTVEHVGHKHEASRKAEAMHDSIVDLVCGVMLEREIVRPKASAEQLTIANPGLERRM